MFCRAVLAAVMLMVASGLDVSARGAGQGPEFRHPDGALAAYLRRDFKVAIGQWRLQAERRDPRAQTWLGVIYLFGDGVARDYLKAAHWFGLAAAQGYGEADYRLGVMYGFGHGFTPDRARAARHFLAAARTGHVKAQIMMSEMFSFGIGVALDLVRSYMWADIAAARAPPGHDLYAAEGNRDTAIEMMTPDQIAEARRLARAWRERHDERTLESGR